MAIELNDNTRVNAPKPSDAWQGPYSSVAAAVAAIPSAFIYPGRTVIITVNGKAVDYWFQDGVNLVEKTTASNGGTGGDTGTERNFPAGLTQGTIKAGDVVTVGTNSTNAALLEKLITAPAAPVPTLHAILATTQTISDLSPVTIEAFVSGWECILDLVGETDGKKQSLWFPYSLIAAQPIGSIQIYDSEDGDYLTANSLDRFDISALNIAGNAGIKLTSADFDRGPIKARLKSTLPGSAYNSTLSAGSTNARGFTLKGLNGLQLQYNEPIQSGELTPASMRINISGSQVGDLTFLSAAIGQACTILYNGQTFQTSFQDNILNL